MNVVDIASVHVKHIPVDTEVERRFVRQCPLKRGCVTRDSHPVFVGVAANRALGEEVEEDCYAFSWREARYAFTERLQVARRNDVTVAVERAGQRANPQSRDYLKVVSPDAIPRLRDGLITAHADTDGVGVFDRDYMRDLPGCREIYHRPELPDSPRGTADEEDSFWNARLDGLTLAILAVLVRLG